MGWLSITAGKSRVMSPRLNSSFISPHAQVSSSLSVLIVSIPKFDCRSLGLSQPSYSLIKYSTSRERKLHLHCELFYFQLSPLRFSCFFFGIYQHRLLLTTTVSLFILCIKTGCAKLYLQSCEYINSPYSTADMIKSEDKPLISPRRYHRGMSFSYQ